MQFYMIDSDTVKSTARLPGDRFEEVRRYLIDCKGDKLSEAEKERINY